MDTSISHPSGSKVALVTGANGISGHAIVEYLVKTPKTEWSEIIVTSRRPPHNFWVDPRVRFISLDFLEAPEIIIPSIRATCKNVTHAFFTSYIHCSDPSKLVETNGPLFRNFLEAIDAACPRLERVSLQTGGKHYGIQFRPFDTPCMEHTPRYDGPGKETLFYYRQEDDLFEIQKRRNAWAYTIIRPFGIVGYTPQFAGMNEALPLAQYFLICRELNQPPKYPGNYAGYHQVELQSYAPSIADLNVWAMTQPHTRNEAFNHGNGDPMAWRFLWTLLGQYFGVSTADCAPAPSAEEPVLSLAEWSRDKKCVWERIIAKYSAGSAESFQEHGFAQMDILLSRPVPGAQFVASIAKARRFGWKDEQDSYEAWVCTFRSYENAGVLPGREIPGTPLFGNWISYLVAKNPDFALDQMSEAEFCEFLADSKTEYASILAANDPDMSEFKGQGGKMIAWHGLADEAIPLGGLVEYYKKVLEMDPRAHDFFRFFEAPGVNHCYGGPGPVPNGALAQLMEWVEQGIVPHTLHATRGSNGTSRDLCLFPLKQTYIGGDPADAQSFECVNT